jgi:3-oxoacyl-[acyl-carrier protein] reductase
MTDRKAAIVTGAGTGVDAASTKWLAAHGYDVLVNYNKSKAAADSISETCRAYSDALAVQGDVSDDSHCRRMVDAVFSKWGRRDALVNSAGTTQFAFMNDLEALNAADFERIYRVNVVGPYQMSRAAVPHMNESGGAIVNVSSLGKPPVVAR